jgi:hypothetical protein
MFKKNHKHKQANILGLSSILPQTYVEEIEESVEKSFYELIFPKNRKEEFSCLYSENFSRPIAPINCILDAILLQAKRYWTVNELFENINLICSQKSRLDYRRFMRCHSIKQRFSIPKTG